MKLLQLVEELRRFGSRATALNAVAENPDRNAYKAVGVQNPRKVGTEFTRNIAVDVLAYLVDVLAYLVDVLAKLKGSMTVRIGHGELPINRKVQAGATSAGRTI